MDNVAPAAVDNATLVHRTTRVVIRDLGISGHPVWTAGNGPTLHDAGLSTIHSTYYSIDH